MEELVRECGSLLVQHIGLGDALICNALTRHFVGTLPLPVGLFAKPGFVNDVKFMYRDLIADKKLIVIPTDPRPAEPKEQFRDILDVCDRFDGPVKNLTMFRENLPHYLEHGQNFDQCFYHYAGVPFIEKFRGYDCPPCPSIEIEPPKEPYVFLHDDMARQMDNST